MKWHFTYTAVLAAVCLALVLAFGGSGSRTASAKGSQGVETIYIVNHAPGFISDKTILRDIPSWEQAANRDFAPVWHTTQVRIELVSKAPANGIEAVFQKSGNIQGALAYHTVLRGQPQIVVYAGTDDYYGYSNSVSFTHELFETLADPTTQGFSVPWHPASYIFIGPHAYQMPAHAVWITEACDAVEAYAYRVHGVAISDFVTPNYFGDQVSGVFDHMNIIQAPYTIAPGGYGSFMVDGNWVQVTNFRHAGRDAAGFLKGESVEDRGQ